MKLMKQPKVRHLLLWLYGLLAFTSAMFLALEATELERDRRTALLLSQANQLADLVIQANAMEALERGATTAALIAPGKPNQALRAKVRQWRARGDGYFSRALSLAEAMSERAPNRQLAARVRDIRIRRAELEAARKRVDDALAGRGTTISPKAWFQSMTTFIESLAQARRSVVLETDPLTEAFLNLVQLKEVVFIASEYAGRERALVASSIAGGHPISEGNRAVLEEYRSLVDQHLQWLSLMTQRESVDSPIRQALGHLQSEFLGRFQKIRTSVYSASDRRVPYPLSAEAWFDEATRGIDSILAVAEAVSQESEQTVVAAARGRQARDQALMVLGTFGTLLVLGFAAVTVKRRLYTPLRQLTEVSQSIAEGDLQRPNRIGGEDEFAELGKAFDNMRYFLLSLARDAIVIHDVESQRVQFWSQGAEALYGWRKDEALGRTLVDLFGQATPEDEAIRQALWGDGVWKGERSRVRKDGASLRVSSSLVLRKSAHGDPIAVFEIDTDVTERVQREAALSQRKHELEELNRRLMEADRYKDDVLSVISHELRTPLNVISGFANILADEMSGSLNPEQHEFLCQILKGTTRMEHLVSDLLDMSRIQAGQLHLVREEIAFDAIVERVISRCRPLAEEKGLTLIGDVEGHPEIAVDSQRIEQVLDNLLENAIKFTTQGSIVVKAFVQGSELVTQVIDTGQGIPPEDLSKLFRKFRQLDMSSTRQAGGVGLGLSICKALVEAHGGTIGVTSVLGQGSTFWFSLPLSAGGGLQQAAGK